MHTLTCVDLDLSCTPKYVLNASRCDITICDNIGFVSFYHSQSLDITKNYKNNFTHVKISNKLWLLLITSK